MLRCSSEAGDAPQLLQALHLLVTATHPSRCSPASVAASMADALPLLGALVSSSKAAGPLNGGPEALSSVYKMLLLVVKQVCQLIQAHAASCMAQHVAEEAERVEKQQQQELEKLQLHELEQGEQWEQRSEGHNMMAQAEAAGALGRRQQLSGGATDGPQSGPSCSLLQQEQDQTLALDECFESPNVAVQDQTLGQQQEQEQQQQQQIRKNSSPWRSPAPAAMPPQQEQRQEGKERTKKAKRGGSPCRQQQPAPETTASASTAPLASLAWAALRLAYTTSICIMGDVQLVRLFTVSRKTLRTWAAESAAAGHSKARLLYQLAAVDPALIETVTATEAVLRPALAAALQQQQQGVGGGAGAGGAGVVMALVLELEGFMQEFGRTCLREVYFMAMDRGALPAFGGLGVVESCQAGFAHVLLNALDKPAPAAAAGNGVFSEPSSSLGGETRLGGAATAATGNGCWVSTSGEEVLGKEGGILRGQSLAGCVTAAGIALRDACASLQQHQKQQAEQIHQGAQLPGLAKFLATVVGSMGNLGEGPKPEDTVATLVAFMAGGRGILDQMPVSFCCNNPNCIALQGPSDVALVLGKAGEGRGVCEECKAAVYCCSKCQEGNWPVHKLVCKQLRKERQQQREQMQQQQQKDMRC